MQGVVDARSPLSLPQGILHSPHFQVYGGWPIQVNMAIDQGDLMPVHIVTVMAMCPCSSGGLLKLAKLVCECKNCQIMC